MTHTHPPNPLCSLLCVFILIILVSPAKAVDDFMGLGDLGAGATFLSTAHGVSADGSVVVGRGASPHPSSTFAQEAFRWTADGGMKALVDVEGGEGVKE